MKNRRTNARRNRSETRENACSWPFSSSFTARYFDRELASVMPEEKQEFFAAGFDARIIKPLNLKSFIETVEKFIGKA